MGITVLIGLTNDDIANYIRSIIYISKNETHYLKWPNPLKGIFYWFHGPCLLYIILSLKFNNFLKTEKFFFAWGDIFLKHNHFD